MTTIRTALLAAMAFAGCLNDTHADDNWKTIRRPQLAQPSGFNASLVSPAAALPQHSDTGEVAAERPAGNSFVDVDVPTVPSLAFDGNLPIADAVSDQPNAGEPALADESTFAADVPEVPVADVSESALAGTRKDTSSAAAVADFNAAVLADSLPWLPVLDVMIQPVSFSQAGAEHHVVPGFESTQTPFLGVQDAETGDAIVADDVFGRSDLRASEAIDLGAAREVPMEAHGSFVNDLQTLVGEDRSAKADGSYLADLNQLLGGQSNWVMTNGAVLDLDPNAPKPTPAETSYLSDLQKLVQGPAVASRSDYRDRLARRLVSLSTYAAAYQQAPVIPQLPADYYEIPPQADCTETGGDSVASLFKPLSEVRVTGVSSAPPQAPKNTEKKSLKLAVPTNMACSYMELDAPGYYFTTGYGVCRAPRNTHPFYHNPLYYEDPNLERCGISKGCLTTAHSAVHFTTMIAVTPYLKTCNHPRSCVKALPDCPTCESFGKDAYFPEWNWKAATVQAAAVTGLIFIIP
ncbi:MAG: hypothetical protein R3C59_00935 [Planctomycetaceae bacterium]